MGSNRHLNIGINVAGEILLHLDVNVATAISLSALDLRGVDPRFGVRFRMWILIVSG